MLSFSTPSPLRGTPPNLGGELNEQGGKLLTRCSLTPPLDWGRWRRSRRRSRILESPHFQKKGMGIHFTTKKERGKQGEDEGKMKGRWREDGGEGERKWTRDEGRRRGRRGIEDGGYQKRISPRGVRVKGRSSTPRVWLWSQ